MKNFISPKFPVIPVAVFDCEYKALKVVEILIKNSIEILEITIRSEIAFSLIDLIKKEFPTLHLGVGSVLSTNDLVNGQNSGAEFFVAPCLDRNVSAFAKDKNMNFIPGVSTPSEINYALNDFSVLKLFPVEPLGGIKYLNSVIAPFKMKNFKLVPTGGINLENVKDYVDHENVLACGMSNVIDKKLIDDENYAEIEKRILKLKKIVS